MDRCSNSGEIREESEKNETEEKESVERRLREKVARPQNTVFRVEKYVGSLKRRVHSHVARHGGKKQIWKLKWGCSKSARGCGMKHMAKSKC